MSAHTGAVSRGLAGLWTCAGLAVPQTPKHSWQFPKVGPQTQAQLWNFSKNAHFFNSCETFLVSSALHLIVQHGKGEASFCKDINVSQLLNYLPYKLLMRHRLLRKPHVEKPCITSENTDNCPEVSLFGVFHCVCVEGGLAFWKWGHTYKKSVSIPKKIRQTWRESGNWMLWGVFSSLGRCYLLCRVESWKIWTELSYAVLIWLKNYLVDKCRIIDWNPLAKRAHKHLNNGTHIFSIGLSNKESNEKKTS